MTTDQIAILFCLALLIAAAFGTTAIARAGADGRLSPNGAVGLRTGATRSSPQAWRAAHAAAITSLRYGAWGTLTLGLIAAVFVIANPSSNTVQVLSAITAVPLLIAVIYGGITGHSTARRIRDHPDPLPD